jgi:hypothetical protein
VTGWLRLVTLTAHTRWPLAKIWNKNQTYCMKQTLIISAILLSIAGCNRSNNEQSLTALNDLYQKEINLSLREADKRAALNPQKAGPARLKISKIDKCFTKIISIIKSNKIDNDGIRLTFENALGIYNIDAIQNDTFLKGRVEIIENKFKEALYKDSDVLLLLSELENKMISNILLSIDSGAFKFNALQAIVVPEKTELFVGEDYHAKIYIAAFDTTLGPIIKFNDFRLPLENYGNGILNIHNSSSGLKKFNGTIEWRVEDKYRIDTLTFEVKYIVK